MKPFETIAVETFLSQWPYDIEFQELLSRLKEEEYGEGEDFIDPVEWLFDYPGEFLAKQISGLNSSLKRQLEACHELN